MKLCLCSRCNTYSIPGDNVCINCGYVEVGEYEDHWLGDLFIFAAFVLMMGGLLWALYEFMIFEHPG